MALRMCFLQVETNLPFGDVLLKRDSTQAMPLSSCDNDTSNPFLSRRADAPTPAAQASHGAALYRLWYHTAQMLSPTAALRQRQLVLVILERFKERDAKRPSPGINRPLGTG